MDSVLHITMTRNAFGDVSKWGRRSRRVGWLQVL